MLTVGRAKVSRCPDDRRSLQGKSGSLLCACYPSGGCRFPRGKGTDYRTQSLVTQRPNNYIHAYFRTHGRQNTSVEDRFHRGNLRLAHDLTFMGVYLLDRSVQSCIGQTEIQTQPSSTSPVGTACTPFRFPGRCARPTSPRDTCTGWGT